MVQEKTRWAGSLGFIMASAGAAVGMGNLWRFPMLVGQNGGGAFLAVYLVCILLIGIPMLLTEIALGKRTGKDAFGSYRSISRRWGGVGILAVVTSLIGLSYYTVLGGWILRYLFVPLGTAGIDAQGFFESFTASPSLQIVFYLITMGITAAIVACGVAKGIEKACRWMMPALFVCLGVLAVRSCTLPGAGEGLSFFLRPDFSKITPKVWILALGQVFFSLSVGAGAGITYGSYLNKKENIVRDAAVIAGFDTLAALLAGFAILPAVFSAGMDPQMGPGLLFVTLPEVFSGIPGGGVLCTLFFVLVLFASLTTTIAFLEVVVSFAVRTIRLPRKKAVLLCAAAASILGIPSALSFGVLGDVSLFGKTLFELADFTVSNICLPLSALLTCLFVGWVWKPANAACSITRDGGIRLVFASGWARWVQLVLPLLIAVIFIAGFLSF